MNYYHDDGEGLLEIDITEEYAYLGISASPNS